MKIYILVACGFLGCAPCAQVIAEVTVAANGDAGTSQAVAPYCAQECANSKDCTQGWHCSLHPTGESGLCFSDEPADSGP